MTTALRRHSLCLACDYMWIAELPKGHCENWQASSLFFPVFPAVPCVSRCSMYFNISRWLWKSCKKFFLLGASKQEFTSEVWDQRCAVLKWTFLGFVWCSWPSLMLSTKHHVRVPLNACSPTYLILRRVLLKRAPIRAVMLGGLLAEIHSPFCFGRKRLKMAC